MPQSAGIISGIQRMVLYETRAVSLLLYVVIVTLSLSGVRRIASLVVLRFYKAQGFKF